MMTYIIIIAVLFVLYAIYDVNRKTAMSFELVGLDQEIKEVQYMAEASVKYGDDAKLHLEWDKNNPRGEHTVKVYANGYVLLGYIPDFVKKHVATSLYKVHKVKCVEVNRTDISGVAKIKIKIWFSRNKKQPMEPVLRTD